MAQNDNNNQREERVVDLEQLFSGSRVRYFFTIFRARFGLLSKTNMLMAIFAMPVAAMIIIFGTLRDAIIANQPHGGNFGIGGYPVILDTATRSSWYVFVQNFYMILGITASIPVLVLGLCGVFYTVKFISKGQIVPIISTFFIGIKKCFLPFLIIGPLLAALFFGIAAGIVGFDHFMEGQNAVKVLLIVLLCIVAMWLMFVMYFYATMSVTYKLNPWQVLINSIKMSISPKLLVRNAIMLLLTAIPIGFIALVLLIPTFGIVIMAIFSLFILFMFIALLWTIYADWVYKYVAVPSVAKKRVGAAHQEAISSGDGTEVDIVFEADKASASGSSDVSIDTHDIAEGDIEIIENELSQDSDSDTQKPQRFKNSQSQARKSNKSSYKFKKK